MSGPFRRLLFAAIGLLAGNAALLLYLLSLVGPQAWQMFVLYAIFSILGWTLVGVPVALAFPGRRLSRAPWPLCLLIGAALGPLALLAIFVLLFAWQGRLNEFSLAHTEGLWPFSILVSTVSFIVYAALLRGRLRNREQ